MIGDCDQITFTTHYVYCIFIRICFIALSKRNQAYKKRLNKHEH